MAARAKGAWGRAGAHGLVDSWFVGAEGLGLKGRADVEGSQTQSAPHGHELVEGIVYLSSVLATPAATFSFSRLSP